MLASVLRERATQDRLQFLVAQLASAHRAQEQALAALLEEPDDVAQRAAELHAITEQHDAHERACVLPVLRTCMSADEYRELAGRYATERLCSGPSRQLHADPTVVTDDARP